MNFLGLSLPNFPAQLSYMPKKVNDQLTGMSALRGPNNAQALQHALTASARSFRLQRAASAIGQSTIMPLLFVEDDFWTAGQYDAVLDAIAATNPAKMADTKDITAGSTSSVPSGNWTNVKNGAHASNEMVGCMLVKFGYTYTHAKSGEKGAPKPLPRFDYVVSGTANKLFKTGTRTYAEHVPTGQGNADSSQVHTEMFLGSQLSAFLDALAAAIGNRAVSPKAWSGIDQPAAYGKNPNLGAVDQAPFSLDQLDVSVRVFIEKGSFCPGCSGTWETLAATQSARLKSFSWEMA